MKLTVNYKTPIKTLVKRGKYDWANSNITDKNFSLAGKGNEEFEAEYFRISKTTTTADIEKQIAEKGLQPLNMQELLHFGIQYPEEQRANHLVALNASWVDPGGRRRVGDLFGDAEVRDCDLDWTEPASRWYPGCVFVVRAHKEELGGLEPLPSSVPLTLEIGAEVGEVTINGRKYVEERK